MHGHSFYEGAFSRVWIPPMSTCTWWFAIGGTSTDAPSNGILPVDRAGWPYLPWHWCNPKRSSNILTDGTFIRFHSISSGDGILLTTRLGAVALTVLWCEMNYRLVVWIPPMSTYTRVLCYLWNYHGYTLKLVCSSPGRADHTHLDIVATLSVQATCCQMVHSLFYSTDYAQAIAYMTTRLGAVAFTVLWCEWSTYMLCTPRTVMQGWVSNTIAIASRWP